jgi:hypothetical protein
MVANKSFKPTPQRGGLTQALVERPLRVYFVEKLLNLPAFFRSHVETDMEYAAA